MRWHMLGISVGTSGARSASASAPTVRLPVWFIPHFAEHTGDLLTLPEWLEADPPATRVWLDRPQSYVMAQPAGGVLAATPLEGLAPGGRMAIELRWYAQAASGDTRLTLVYVDDAHRVYWSRAAARFVVEWGGVVVQSDPGDFAPGDALSLALRARSDATVLLLSGPGGASGSYYGPPAPPLPVASSVQLFGAAGGAESGSWIDKVRFEQP